MKHGVHKEEVIITIMAEEEDSLLAPSPYKLPLSAFYISVAKELPQIFKENNLAVLMEADMGNATSLEQKELEEEGLQI